MATLEQTMARLLDECIHTIKANAMRAGKVATGRTLNALEGRVRNEGNAIIGEIWGLKHTGALETGSAPARRSGSPTERTAMVQAMKEWCAIRGLSAGMTDKQAENLAKYLSWYIKRYGSKLYREGGRRDIITPAIEQTQKALEQELSLYFDTLLSKSLDDAFFKGHVDINGQSRYN